jgi:glycosyltransferase involved in cell wall biosynthesis
MPTVAIQYPSFGPQHPPRLRAIVRAAPPEWRVVAMEMFAHDSDYEWAPVPKSDETFKRYTAIDSSSADGRRSRTLKRDVWRALDDISPDVLVVNGWGHLESRASLAWCKKRGRSAVLLSDSSYEDAPRVWYKELYKKWLVRGCRSAFVAGTPQARYAERLGIPREHIFHPGSCVVDNDYWAARSKEARAAAAELRKKFALPEQYFLCVARYIPKKNVPFLVRSYARYRSEAGAGAFGLVLCGSGPEETAVCEAISELSLEGSVKLAGFRQIDELPVFHGLASCFIMPSSGNEQWGLVVNEAMASGLPVLVSSRCGCAEDLVREGVNGYTFDPDDESELAKLMLEIQNADKRRAMGRESRRIIAGHSCDVGAENLWKAVWAAQL